MLKLETIDIAPTWETAVRICIEVLKNQQAGTGAHKTAEEELIRLAKHVDAIKAKSSPSD